MDLGLYAKTALITGSTKGIGKAIATELAREGTNIIINGRHKIEVLKTVTQLQTLFPNVKILAGTADLTNPLELNNLLKKYPNIDILINNMGIFEPINYWDITDENWNKFFQTNVMTGNHLAKYYLPKMLSQNFGRIIFIASEEAIMPSGQMAQYSMTKTMNLSLAKSLAKLTKGTNVTVNTIMPGSTLTEGVKQMLYDMYKDSTIPPEKWEYDFMKNCRPLSEIQRFIRPQEIGRFTAFIASPFTTAFSGAALRMDGGLVPTIF